MPTLPPRSLSASEASGRVLCLPNGRCTHLAKDYAWIAADPISYSGGWEQGRDEEDPPPPHITDLTDAEIREICHASADGREGVIARIAASRKAADPQAPRTYALSIPDSGGDRILTYPDGSWWWLLSADEGEDRSETSPVWPADRKPDLEVSLHLTEAEALSLLPRDGREDRIAQIRASRQAESFREETGKILDSWAPAYSPEFAESMRAQGLGAREPTWEEPEDLVAEPPHYRLPGGREALEDVIAPICDALSDRRLPGSAVYMVGNALKYLSRLGAKGSALEDLRKAREYLDRAIARMDAGA